MKVLFKILSALFTILFLVSAGLQYNDPDPLLWILVWGIAAVLSILFFLHQLSFRIPLIVGVLCLIGCAYLFPSNFQGFALEDGDIKNIELAREAVGLFIISLVMFIYAFRIRYLKNSMR